jgi:membrane fusion protein (multidrug efflux system)
MANARTAFKTLAASSVIASALFIGACSDDVPKQTPPAPAVSVFSVQSSPVGKFREFVARSEASQTVDLRARIEGEITHRNFTEGGFVKQGDLLFEIDRRPYQAELDKAQANLAARQAEELQADADYERGKELAPDGYISQSDLGKLRSASSQADANVKGAEAALETARINLDYTNITAPFDGKIGKRRYDVGTLVGPSSESLATLSASDPIYINFQLEESAYINFLQKRTAEGKSGQDPALDLSLRLPNGDEYGQAGKIDFADTKIDSTVGSVNLRAIFPNTEGLILPGLYVTLLVESQQKEQLPLIPQAAVQENQLGNFVLVINDKNQVNTRHVEMGRRMGAMWVVNGGLKNGEKIIIEGLQKVRSGVEVNPIEKTVDPQTGAVVELGQVIKDTAPAAKTDI